MLGSVSINAGVSTCPARKAICSSVGRPRSSWCEKPSEVTLGASSVFLDLMENLTDPSPRLSSALVNSAARTCLRPSPSPPAGPARPPRGESAPHTARASGQTFSQQQTRHQWVLFKCPGEAAQFGSVRLNITPKPTQFSKKLLPKRTLWTHDVSTHVCHTLPAMLANPTPLPPGRGRQPHTPASRTQPGARDARLAWLFLWSVCSLTSSQPESQGQ